MGTGKITKGEEKKRVRGGEVGKEEKVIRWERWERLVSCTDCQCSKERINWATITQSEFRNFDNSSGNQLSCEIDVSKVYV